MVKPTMSRGCTRCEPGAHLPPPRRVCPDLVFPDEPRAMIVACPTSEMLAARWWRAVEWALVIALGATVAIKILNETIRPPAALGSQTWFWLSVVVLVAWGIAAFSLALKTVSRTPDIGIMLGKHPFVAVALGSWIVAVATGGGWRVGAAVVAAAASLLEAYRSYTLGHEKPSVSTYALFLGFKAYLAGLSIFMLAVVLDHSVGLGAALAALGVGAWASIDLFSFILPFPILTGLVAWELERSTNLDLVAMAAFFTLLVLRGFWYRLFSSNPRHGRNLFVFPLSKTQ